MTPIEKAAKEAAEEMEASSLDWQTSYNAAVCLAPVLASPACQNPGSHATRKNDMKEKPILFSAPMVRAILDGSKTQTRRIVTPQPPDWAASPEKNVGEFVTLTGKHPEGLCGHPTCGCQFRHQTEPLGLAMWTITSRFGQPGERLWVKETFCEIPFRSGVLGFAYRADGDSAFDEIEEGYEWLGKWKPSIFCTRKASRITLEIVSVRVERLQEISEEDAQAEGVSVGQRAPYSLTGEVKICTTCGKYKSQHIGALKCCPQGYGTSFNPNSFKGGFKFLWSSINGPDSWTQNPWVWVITFKRINQ